MAITGEKIHISATHRARQKFVPDRATIDEQILMLGVAARIGGNSRKARKAKTVALHIDRERVFHKFTPQNRAKAFQAHIQQITLCGRRLIRHAP